MVVAEEEAAEDGELMPHPLSHFPSPGVHLCDICGFRVA